MFLSDFIGHHSFTQGIQQSEDLFCLFGLRLYVPVNNFSVMSGWSHRFLGITSTFWDVNIHSEDNVPYIVASMIGLLNLHFILFE